MTPKWGFGVAMLPVGVLCFYQAHFGRTVLPKWPLRAHLFYSVFYSVLELSFRQVHVARAVLLPSALFRAGALRFLPVPPNPTTCACSHIWGFPKTALNCFFSTLGSSVSAPFWAFVSASSSHIQLWQFSCGPLVSPDSCTSEDIKAC